MLETAQVHVNSQLSLSNYSILIWSNRFSTESQRLTITSNNTSEAPEQNINKEITGEDEVRVHEDKVLGYAGWSLTHDKAIKKGIQDGLTSKNGWMKDSEKLQR